MVLLSERSSQVWNIASIAISITAQKIPISPLVNGSGACNGSSPRAMPNGFSLPMGLSPNIFVHGDIGFLLPSIVKSSEPDSRSGRKSRLQPWLSKRVF